MRNVVSRRSVLKTISALVGAGAVGVTGEVLSNEPHPDAELLAKVNEYQKQSERVAEMQVHAVKARDAVYADADYPKTPEIILTSDGAVLPTGRLLLMGEIEYIYTSGPRTKKARLFRDKRLAALKEYHSRRGACNTKHRRFELENLAQNTHAELMCLAREVLNIPANSTDGLMVKLNLWAVVRDECRHKGFCLDIGEMVLEDAKRLSDQKGGHHV